MENPIQMDDLGKPLFLETLNLFKNTDLSNWIISRNIRGENKKIFETTTQLFFQMEFDWYHKKGNDILGRNPAPNSSTQNKEIIEMNLGYRYQ